MVNTPVVEGIFELSKPMTKIQMDAKITSIMTMADEKEREAAWHDVFTAVHEQALFYPISYMVNVAVVNK